VRSADGTWERAPPEKVHDKITQDYRNLRWAKKNRNQLYKRGSNT
jgi:hypothetical protein